jgi:hypothetical protein
MVAYSFSAQRFERTVRAVLRRIGPLAPLARSLDRCRVGIAQRALAANPGRDRVARDAAVDSRIRNAVAAEPIRAVHAARILPATNSPGSVVEQSTANSTPPIM